MCIYKTHFPPLSRRALFLYLYYQQKKKDKS